MDYDFWILNALEPAFLKGDNMKCPVCGKLVDEGEEYCPNCGYDVYCIDEEDDF